MFGLYISLAALGLSAIDPIGIGIMPILLVQKHPYRRALVFLSGSFVSLMVMGLLFAKGLGQAVLRFEHGHTCFVPDVERVAGVILLVIAATLYLQLRAGEGFGGAVRQDTEVVRAGQLAIVFTRRCARGRAVGY